MPGPASDRRGQDARGDRRGVLEEYRETNARQDGYRIQPRQRKQRAQANCGDGGGLAKVALDEAGEPGIETLEFRTGSACYGACRGDQQYERERALQRITTALHDFPLEDR